MLLDEVGDLIGGHERLVPGQDHHRPILDGVARGQHGRPRPLPFRLLGDLDAVRQAFGDAVLRPHDAHDTPRTGRACGIRDPLDHGLPADPVKNLGGLRPHPRAPAGGHDEDREGLGHGPVRVPVRGR
jgi:hypothetical protein